MDEVKKKLVFEMPNAQTPGYLYRLKNSMEYNKKIKSRKGIDPELVDDMIDFLLPYITEPEDRDEARRLMLTDLTEEQFTEMFEALSPKEEEEEENPIADGKPSTKSEPLEEDKKQ